MKILLLGNGGREHALCDALARSAQKPDIFNFATAINPGIAPLVREIKIGDICNPVQVTTFAKIIQPDFAVIGPENPLATGVTDELKKIGIPCFAPSKAGAQLESSKSFTRNLLKKYYIDASPDFEVFETKESEERKKFFDSHKGQIVVKADGLIGGKGVLVAGDHFSEFEQAESFARQSIGKFGRVVLEEKLVGEEFSLISLVDGETVLDTPAIQDHKRAFENDTGPNTGGMGCVSDEHHSLPFLSEKEKQQAHQITVQVMKALEQELGEKYVGVMYGGFMVTRKGVKLIEYNARFGDPEALNILPILKTDFVDVCQKAIQGKLSEIGALEFEPQATVVKYLCPEGYPTNPVKEKPVTGPLRSENPNARIFFASVAEESGQLILKGSRAIGVVGLGTNLEEANRNCESEIQKFSGPLFYRKDIGTAPLIQQRIAHMVQIRSN
ncbi:phosphoribosylamine--glycine ligase [Candidatus Gracilibacteria bacterium]|nr:phosphoribosylamine--glycine ligase [Candidatus Gracilibacteria bacterium]MCF7819749.1 phosphoribosylamine--glycine ligase [Candidatus Gracilibacteria bacterium]